MLKSIRLFSLLSVLLLYELTFSNPNSTTVNSGLRMGIDQKGNAVYETLHSDGIYHAINQEQFQNGLLSIGSTAISVACKLPIIPNSVTASVGVFSITWNLNDQICKKNEK